MQEKPITTFNELEMEFLRKSKWKTKNKKNWKGKKKPENFIHPSKFEGLPDYLIEQEKKRILEKRENKQYKKSIKKFLKSVKSSDSRPYFTCPYCNEDYNNFNEHFCSEEIICEKTIIQL